jgi:quercetin dioxygenase-like cupin family protein
MTTEELHGKQARLADLIQVQPGAVVSKTLIEQPAGTVTLFAFDKGQRLSEHTAPFDALVTALEGRVDIVLNGVRHPLAAGDAIIMPAGVTHAVDAVEACIWLLTMIRS